jgi:hypothetical protein
MCGVAYGLLFGQVKQVTDVCKGRTKRDLSASQVSSSANTLSRAIAGHTASLIAVLHTRQQESSERGVTDTIHRGSSKSRRDLSSTQVSAIVTR